MDVSLGTECKSDLREVYKCIPSKWRFPISTLSEALTQVYQCISEPMVARHL